MDDMVWLTLGLLFVAGMQVWIQHRAEDARQRERKTAEDRRADVIWQTAYAEHLRLERLADVWDDQDLVMDSALGILDAHDVLPSDWPVFMRELAELSAEAGYLGALAGTLSRDLARDVAEVNGLVKAARAQWAPSVTPDVIAKGARSNYGPQLDELTASISKNVRELSLLIWDAIQHSPRASLVRVLSFHDDMLSDLGNAAAKEIAMRGARLSKK